MATFEDDSRIVPCFKPSLLYMSISMTAVGFYNDFGMKILNQVFPKMESLGLQEFKHCNPESFTVLRDRAKQRLLLLPWYLRNDLIKAIERTESEILDWIRQHERKDRHYYYYKRCTFFWRSDGTIDRTKTAQEIVSNQNINIGARFEVACMYCLVKTVQALWAVLEANGKTEYYEMPYSISYCNAMVDFWVRWLREGAQFHWTHAAHEYLNFRLYARHRKGTEPRFSTLFRELMPVDRCKFFKDLRLCKGDDLRCCLYIATNKEQLEIMRHNARKVLLKHTIWPLSSLFLEIAEKSWKFLSRACFYLVLHCLLNLRDKDLDYYEYLAEEFWCRSPDCLKEPGEEQSVWISKKVTKFIKERKYM